MEQAPALEADELEKLALAASVPHLEKRARVRFFERMARLARPHPPAPAIKIIAHDPAQAAAYFRAMGIDVVHNE